MKIPTFNPHTLSFFHSWWRGSPFRCSDLWKIWPTSRVRQIQRNKLFLAAYIISNAKDVKVTQENDSFKRALCVATMAPLKAQHAGVCCSSQLAKCALIVTKLPSCLPRCTLSVCVLAFDFSAVQTVSAGSLGQRRIVPGKLPLRRQRRFVLLGTGGSIPTSCCPCVKASLGKTLNLSGLLPILRTPHCGSLPSVCRVCVCM